MASTTRAASRRASLTQERATFGNRSVDTIVIFSSPTAQASDPAFRAEVERTLASVPRGTVAAAQTWYDAQDPAMVSKDGHATAVYVSLVGTSQDDFGDAFERMEPVVAESSLATDFAGPYAVYVDVNKETKADLLRAESGLDADRAAALAPHLPQRGRRADARPGRARGRGRRPGDGGRAQRAWSTSRSSRPTSSPCSGWAWRSTTRSSWSPASARRLPARRTTRAPRWCARWRRPGARSPSRRSPSPRR
ncbi:MMPL family transporter [Nocardioides convexus]|uniref:MMPL family transporter n=1 Tax=Nocardioides convexus TaxID=2712224 RepID=UPI0024185621|nr:MMPL family transporter [Nocardioides convexus]